MDLTIYRCYTDTLIQQTSLSKLLVGLPDSLHPKAHRYKSDPSAYNYVVGRLLLKRGLETFGLDTDLEKLQFQKNGKPLVSGIHFNISHSHHQVICAFSKDGQLGVDLEKIRPIDFEDFTAMFSTKEWLTIKGAKDPLRSFYWFWTRKESIIKALGLNLSYLHRIELDVSKDHLVIDGKPWFLHELELGEGYLGTVCSELEVPDIHVEDIELVTT